MFNEKSNHGNQIGGRNWIVLLLIALCEQSEEFNDLYFRGRTVQEYFTKCEAAKSLDRGLVVQWMSRTGLINPRRLIVAVQFRTVKFVGGQNDPLRSHGSIQFFLLRSISYLLSRFGQSLASRRFTWHFCRHCVSSAAAVICKLRPVVLGCSPFRSQLKICGKSCVEAIS